MPIKKIFYSLLCILLFTNTIQTRRNIHTRKSHVFTIMLDPAGDAKHTGRSIGNTFERGITFQFAEHLKQYLENNYENIKIYLSRFPAEMIYPLQNANYANRLDINLYININFYQEINTIPKLFLYRFSYHDDFITSPKKLSFLKYDQAHIVHNTITQEWSQHIKQALIKDTHKKFTVHGVYGLPFKPLIGVVAPAIGIEAGLKTAQDWKPYIIPIAQAIGTLIKKYV
jgi:N-acetylmuramoyl-L-alanine amidase